MRIARQPGPKSAADSRPPALAVLGALVLTATATLAWGQNSFTGLGTLPGDATSNAYGVSRDGNLVTGESIDGAGAAEAFIYSTLTGGKTALGFPAGWTASSGAGVDTDTNGAIYVAGSGKNALGNSQAFFWDGSLATPAFTEVPFLTGGSVSYGRAVRWSSGEVYVIGKSSRSSGLKDHGFRWRKTSPTGSLDLGDTETDPGGDGNKGDAECIGIRTGGASVIRGSSETGYPSGGNNPTSFSWYSGDSFNYCLWWTRMTTSTGPLRSHAHGTSPDGRYIVGSSTIDTSVYEWNRQAYLHDIEDGELDKTCNPPGGHFHTLQYCVVPDGTGGASCNWNSTMLGYLPGHNLSEAYGVSADGTIVVGSSVATLPEIRTGGNLIADTQALGDDIQVTPVGTNTGSNSTPVVRPGPNGVLDSVKSSSDSLSYYYPDSNFSAFIWDPTNGMRDLKQVLVGLGLNLDNWILTDAKSISSDGTVICGLGKHNGATEGWVATIGRAAPIWACCNDAVCTETTLPECAGTYHAGQTCAVTECCHSPAADSDGDHDVDMDDFARFQKCINTGNTASVAAGCKCWDWDGGGVINEDDFIHAFVNCGSGSGIPTNCN